MRTLTRDNSASHATQFNNWNKNNIIDEWMSRKPELYVMNREKNLRASDYDIINLHLTMLGSG